MSLAFVFLFVSFLAIADGQCTERVLEECFENVPQIYDFNLHCGWAEDALQCANTFKIDCIEGKENVDSLKKAFKELEIGGLEWQVQTICAGRKRSSMRLW